MPGMGEGHIHQVRQHLAEPGEHQGARRADAPDQPAAGECAGERRGQAEDGRDGRHIFPREAERAVEGRGHDPRQRLAEFVERDEGEDREPQRALGEIGEGFDDRDAHARGEAQGRAAPGRCLARRERGGHAHAHQRRHHEIGSTPAEGGDEEQRPAAGDEQRQAIAPDIGGKAPGLLAFGQHLDPQRIDDDVLAGREKGDEHGDHDQRHQGGAGVGQRDGGDAEREGRLDGQQPAAALAEPGQGRTCGVQRRRPEELVGIGQADQRGEADGAEREVRLREPLPQHLSGDQRQGQPGREAEGKQHGVAAVTERAGTGRCGRFGHAATLADARRAGQGARECRSFRRRVREIRPQALVRPLRRAKPHRQGCSESGTGRSFDKQGMWAWLISSRARRI